MATKITPRVTSDGGDGCVQRRCCVVDICIAGIEMKFVMHLDDQHLLSTVNNCNFIVTHIIYLILAFS